MSSGIVLLDNVWSYDAAGNRLTQWREGEVTNYVSNAANQVTSATDLSGATLYDYDAAGNQISIETPSGDITTTTWDYESRQQSVETPTGTLVTLTYNCDDWRVQRDDGFDVTRYQYDKNNLLAELDGSTPLVVYTNEPDEYGRVISQHRPGDDESRYYQFDVQGSTIGLTGPTGEVTDDYAYDAWGQVVAETGTSLNPLQYIGELGYYRDEDLQRTHVRRREYDEILGRFFSEDPLRQAGGDDNLYRYANNDPINHVDPSGLWCWVCPIDKFNYTAAGPGRWTISGSPGNVFIGVYSQDSNAVERTLIDGSRYQVQYSTLLSAMNRGVLSSGWQWREWDDWFRKNGKLLRNIPLNECGLNVATMSRDEKITQALGIAYAEGHITGVARQMVGELLKPENATILLLVVGALASLGVAASAAGGTATTLGGPLGAAGAGLAALFVGDLLLTWYRMDLEISNATHCSDLDAAAPVVAEFFVKAAAVGVLEGVVRLVRAGAKKPTTPPKLETPPSPPPEPPLTTQIDVLPDPLPPDSPLCFEFDTGTPFSRLNRSVGTKCDVVSGAKILLNPANRSAVEALADFYRGQLSTGGPKTVAVLKTSNGSFNGRSGFSNAPHPVVQQVLDSIPQDQRALFHGNCAEVDAVSQSLRAAEVRTGQQIVSIDQATNVLAGASVQTARVRGPNSTQHGTPIPPCESCAPFLKALGVLHE